MRPLVEMKGITKEFTSVVANDGVDFELFSGEVHSLVGENGAGKTTLMRILYGQYEPDEGEILIDGNEVRYNIHGAIKHGIAMVHQNFMQVEELSILENVILANMDTRAGFILRKKAETRVNELLVRFGVNAKPETIVAHLSVGERQWIEIIKAVYVGARILILDEPTAVLTPQETDKLFAIIAELKKDGTSIVFISHKLREVVAISDRVSVMRKGKMTGTFDSGNFTETDIACAMIGKQKVQLIQNNSDFSIGEEAVCEASGLWYFDDEALPVVRDFSFSIHKGEILGIGGVEGNGQSELVDLLFGMKKPSGGSIRFMGTDITDASISECRNAGIGIIPDDRIRVGLSIPSTLDENLICGIEENGKFNHNGLLRLNSIREYANELVDTFDIRGVAEDHQIAGMSGGNLQKIILAREISRGPKLLIAAQPTRGLDIGAINFVREQLLHQKEMGTAILLITADLEELLSLSDRILIMYEGGCTGEVSDVASATEGSLGLLMGGIKISEVGQGA
ncbi:heme ABC transporter ATP-binding protein [Clostridia bacterium]|nr:heme ABC transporter ATP-binding protein [Clostridia bacterium]